MKISLLGLTTFLLLGAPMICMEQEEGDQPSHEQQAEHAAEVYSYGQQLTQYIKEQFAEDRRQREEAQKEAARQRPAQGYITHIEPRRQSEQTYEQQLEQYRKDQAEKLAREKAKKEVERKKGKESKEEAPEDE